MLGGCSSSAPRGVATRHIALPGCYPDPSAADLAGTAELMAAAPPDAVLLIDGLAYGAMPADLIEGFRRPVVALVHHPLGLEAGLTPDRRAALLASEAAALGLARRIVVTSPLTGRLLASDFNVDGAVIAVAEPGTDPAGRSRGTGSPVRAPRRRRHFAAQGLRRSGRRPGAGAGPATGISRSPAPPTGTRRRPPLSARPSWRPVWPPA